MLGLWAAFLRGEIMSSVPFLWLLRNETASERDFGWAGVEKHKGGVSFGVVGGGKSVEMSLDAANRSVCATFGRRFPLSWVVLEKTSELARPVSWLDLEVSRQAWTPILLGFGSFGWGVAEREGFLAHFFEVLLPGLGRFGGFGFVFLFGGFEALFVDFESLLIFAVVFDDFFAAGHVIGGGGFVALEAA